MKARPILFSEPMVRALLAGSKTQTRRVVKPQPIMRDGEPTWPADAKRPRGRGFEDCPYGKSGDLLWVPESCAAKELTTEEAQAMWKASPDYDGLPPDHLYGLDGVAFSADNAFAPIKNTREAADAWVDLNAYRGKRGATVPPIHMPRWASRLTLRITDVRVQRLQEISEADAVAEGIERRTDCPGWNRFALAGDSAGLKEGCAEGAIPTAFPKLAYRSIWETINGSESWAANPWVWAISFEVIRQNVDAVLAAKEAA